MGEKRKSSSNFLIQGTILAVASVIARIIGMIYRIPLTNILGDEGNTYFSTANEIYSILLMISSFSLPLAVSKLVSERLHKGQFKNARRVFQCSVKFAVVSGGVISILTFFLAGFISDTLMKTAPAAYGVRILAPAVFIFAITGVFRGFFQGQNNMVPTAVSQIIEQVVNAVIAVICASMLFTYGTSLGEKSGDLTMGPALAAAGGTFGKVVSVGVALAFLMILYASYQKHFKRQLSKDPTKRLESERHIYRALLLTIIPVVLSTVLYNITPLFDQGIYNSIMAEQGYNIRQYSAVWGIYVGKFRVLMNVPLVLASCLAPSVVPSLAGAMADNNFREAKVKVRNTIRYTMVLTIPCAVGMLALATPINFMLFGDDRQLTEGIMQTGSLMIVFFALSTLSTGVLQGMNKMKIPLINAVIALVIHIIVLFPLTEKLNIYGVVYANTLFAVVISLLNALAIRKHLHYKQEVKKTFLIPLMSSAGMGIAAFVIHWMFNKFFLLFSGARTANLVATTIAILVGALVYLICLIKLRGIKEEEILGLPKGTAMVAILHKCRLM